MSILGIKQPEILPIDDKLRLRKYDGMIDFAFDWYQDVETVYLVDGNREPYTYQLLQQMYSYLDRHGELYFIEVLENGTYRPIGDVTFWKDDMPIVIGDIAYRGKGIGRKVISALVERGRDLGYDKLYVNEIYDFNEGSRKCFEGVGFRAYEKTDKGNRFVLDLKEKGINMYFTYVMGIDDSVLELQNQGFGIERDGDNYMISFPAERSQLWETFITKHLEFGYWNEYFADDRVVFLFHLETGIKRYEVYNYTNDEVLELCERLCECKFGSLENMLMGNHFYKGKLI